jgi:hypothetical protein
MYVGKNDISYLPCFLSYSLYAYVFFLLLTFGHIFLGNDVSYASRM